MFEVVLFEPEIPPNTGNIMRLCANSGCRLHLVRPLGFSLSDKQLERAGMDYRSGIDYTLHDDWEHCRETLAARRIYTVTTKGLQRHDQVRYQAGDVFVSAAQATDFDDKVQTSLIIRGRNDWDGNVLSLKAFVTPNDPDLLRFSRKVLADSKDSLGASAKELEHFQSATLLFNEFASRMVYVNDPQSSKDRVQYPSETLSLRGGDCDDMTVFVSSMLASVGIATAFVDVVPPSKPQEGHIYLLFDTGVPVAKAAQVSSNPKRYVVRKNERGQETVWIPVETTAMGAGFEKAWEAGAKAYYEDVEVALGLARGWVRIVDVQPVL